MNNLDSSVFSADVPATALAVTVPSPNFHSRFEAALNIFEILYYYYYFFFLAVYILIFKFYSTRFVYVVIIYGPLCLQTEFLKQDLCIVFQAPYF